MSNEGLHSLQATARRLGEFAAMARGMAAPTDLERTLELLSNGAQQAFLCDAVGIMLVQAGKVTTVAASGPDVGRADELQTESGQGPCLEAIRRQEDFIVDDLRTDPRWPVWGPQAAALGWRSILSVGLVGGEKPLGALNLYSRQTDFFTADDLGLGEVFSAQASVALAGAQERDSLLKAVEARHVIGLAQGILMERYSIDAQQAFTVLRRYSSHMNRKLRLVAEDVVKNRKLPEA
ncbi:MAG TPA: GAF and ANTAR domain-containing protein [Propionibacteriaceae bacterium]